MIRLFLHQFQTNQKNIFLARSFLLLSLCFPANLLLCFFIKHSDYTPFDCKIWVPVFFLMLSNNKVKNNMGLFLVTLQSTYNLSAPIQVVFGDIKGFLTSFVAIEFWIITFTVFSLCSIVTFSFCFTLSAQHLSLQLILFADFLYDLSFQRHLVTHRCKPHYPLWW